MTGRVILLGPLPPPYGGPEVMTRTLLDGLSQRNDLVIRHINTQVSRSLAEKGGKYQLSKSLRAFVQTIHLVVLMFSFRPHVVYMPLTNSPSFLGFMRDSLFMIPALLLGKELVIRLHGGYYFYAHTARLKRTLVQVLLGRVSLAMVQGQRLASAFDDLVPPERIVVIPNGLDDRPFAEARQRQRDTKDSKSPKRVLFVGLMCPEKGFRDIVAAVPAVPGARFVFVGEWPSAKDEQEVRDFLKQHGVEERVTFAGVVSGSPKYDLFVSADIFIFPTYFVYEGHAVSSVEALAAGLPIVCTDHGALNESVKHGWNGYFIPRSDPEAIAHQLNRLLRDEDLRQTMGQRSRKLYEKRFTLPQFVDTWVQAVLQCAANPGKDEG